MHVGEKASIMVWNKRILADNSAILVQVWGSILVSYRNLTPHNTAYSWEHSPVYILW